MRVFPVPEFGDSPAHVALLQIRRQIPIAIIRIDFFMGKGKMGTMWTGVHLAFGFAIGAALLVVGFFVVLATSPPTSKVGRWLASLRLRDYLYLLLVGVALVVPVVWWLRGR